MSNMPLLVLPFLVSFAITAVVGKFTVRWLRSMKAGQSILEDAPETHRAKEGTPTMGGIMFLTGITVSSLLFSLILHHRLSADIVIMVVSLLLFAMIGVFDDYVKISNGRNLGLTAKQKLLFQIVIAAVIAVYQAKMSECGTAIYVPIARTWWDLGVLYIPFVVFVLVAMVNAVNLNDGLDGMAGGCSGIVAVFLALIALNFGTDDSIIYTSAVAGGCAAFLLYNHHPAKVFMGDTGSLALGGALAVSAVMMHVELILVTAGIMFVLEALSVVLQVSFFKLTKKIFHTEEGKRIFAKTPLHHHFEEGGWTGRKWKETEVVLLFWSLTAVFCVIAWFIM